MKTNIIAIASLIASITSGLASEKIKAPNNGRIIECTKPNAEFLITPEKKIEIRFLDAAGKVISPADQIVTVTMGDRTKPTKLTFAKDGDKLVSNQTIPDGNELPVVVQIKTTPEAKSTNSKFNLNFTTCPECKHPEYACSCDHHEKDDDASHDH